MSPDCGVSVSVASSGSSETMLHFSSTLLLAAACLLVSTGAERAITCGNHVHRLSCETGVIRVQESMYGRTNPDTCSGEKPEEVVTNTACSLEGAEDIIKTRCDGKKVCEVTPAIFARDPCHDTFKYLQTSYACVPSIHLITCEQSMVQLQCDEGHVIHVYHADFGRHDANICSFRQDASHLQNVKCSNPTDKVAERCNGKHSCTMRASSTLFGDTCPKTYKYLELTYNCLKPADV
ncbi:L-rhamnose-binding lectin SML-like [Archocentrus centrarchus]|uniref:L-rhamnose-binding lectin SML-like n=1 Tax=Archocentrus centrarchus TaxID=63155 RepID=UPI0011E9BB33|nr:L-rhamnose-binding lectin SML-like [Archocentrus centrarchus]